MKKYIKYFLKFIEKLIFPFEAKPIIKINEISEDNVALAINTKKKTKKKLSILLKEHQELAYFQILYLY